MMNPKPAPEQLAVVDYPLAPVRVAAGAGTGKTATIAMRIVRLVTQLGIEPESILGITFTNKAAAELADRIRTALGSRVDTGREIEVHTYHGFAHQILREYGALVGVERATQVITPTFSRQLIEVVIAGVELPALNPANRANVDDIRSLGSALGDNLLTPADVTIPDPPSDKGWESRASLLKALDAYQREKSRRGVVDYSDLILAAYRLVANFPEIAAEIRSRYRAVMLDEYQDTNPAQRELLRRIFGNGFPVTAVGDVDQTIYEWRGASSHNFTQFPNHFRTAAGEEAESLALTLNRRSLPVVLQVANAVRSRTGSDQQLLRSLDASIGGEVAVSWHANAVEEAQEIARKIEELSATYQWKQMAVLFRKNKDMTLVHDALRAAGIPVEVANLGGLLAVPEVTDLHAWLRLLHDPEDTPALFRILFGARYRLGMGDLVHLTRWAKSQNRSRARDVELPPNTLLEATDHLEELIGIRPEARKALDDFRHEYRTLLVAAQGVSLVELCRRVLDTTGAWNDLAAMPLSSQLSARLNLYRFLDLAEDWSPLEGAPSLPAFLSHLGAMAEEKAEELDTARLSGADAVTLVTVHRAKGLEWEVVFLPAVYKKNFPAGSMGFDNPFTKGRFLPYEYRLDRQWLPPIGSHLSEEDNNELLRDQHERQEWRIAYVAATRAKERLFVSGASWYGRAETNRKPSQPSELWEVIANHPATRVDSRPLKSPPPQPTVMRFEHEVGAPDPLFAQGWEASVRDEVESPGTAERLAFARDREQFEGRRIHFQQMLFELPEPLSAQNEETPTTSVTGLVTFASCPLRYHWSEVDRLPRISSAAARRGSQVHRAIELHNRGQMPLEDFETFDTDPLDPYKGTSSWNGFQTSRFADKVPVMIEQPFGMRFDAMYIRGRIDAIYGETDWEIVDFKTGSESSDEAVRTASLVQLQAYGLAATGGHLGRPPSGAVAVTFAYLGSTPSETTYQADQSWLEGARQRITGLVTGINLGEKLPTPSLACHGCDFLHVCPAGQLFVGA